jgi:RNA-directed DNA polymerase
MPALLGGFLRRNSISVELISSAIGDTKMARLLGVAVANEPLSEGPMNRRKCRLGEKDISKRSAEYEIELGLTRVNLCMKTGPTRTSESLSCLWTTKQEEQIRSRLPIITPVSNTRTEGVLISILTKVIFTLMTNTGTPENGSLDYQQNRELWSINQWLMLLTGVTYYLILKAERADIGYLDGGKISDQANAKGNAFDSEVPKTHKDTSKSYTISSSLQNSELHKRFSNNYCLNTRFYSSSRDPIEAMTLDSEKGGSIIIWPTNAELAEMKIKVFKKQQAFVEKATISDHNIESIQKEQLIMARSLLFRIVAVDLIIHSTGSQTPGIDGESISTKTEKTIKQKYVEWLALIVKEKLTYIASPVKRILIPKGTTGKFRTLGIPTIRDRMLQQLINLVLEPLVEMNSDIHSYGFRKHRSAKNAIGILRQHLNSEGNKYQKYILDADIKGFFDNINHNWLIENIPLKSELKALLIKVLKSGTIEQGKWIETNNGTPQGGIISPTLANFTLNGLEKAVYDSILGLTKSKERRIVIKFKDGTKTRIASKLFVVRYVDDFVVLARSNHILTTYVKPAIETFLETRGLTLSIEKTKVITLQDEKTTLNFLGYSFIYKSEWDHKKHLVYAHSAEAAIALMPQISKIRSIIEKLRTIYRASTNLTAFELITTLNPIIRGWCGYFNLGNSSRYRDFVRQALYKYTWEWAHKKHPKWGKRLIASQYFKTTETIANIETENYIKVKGRMWAFHGITLAPSHYTERSGKSIYLLDPSNCYETLSAKHFIIPKVMENIHAYSPDFMKLVEFQTNLGLLAINSKFPSIKDRLTKKQNGLCGICNHTITLDHLANKFVHIHHIKPVFKKGSKADVNNMLLVHSWCHRTIDHWEV